jgi:glycosyltransferase 2 family protein
MAHRWGLETIAGSMRSANFPYLVYALFAFIASGVLGSVQWGILLRFHGIHPGVYGTVSRYFMGLFFNYILPGFVGGDVVRVYHATKISGRITQAFSSTLADRVIGLMVLVLFSLGAFMLMPKGPAGNALPIALAIFLLLAGSLCVFRIESAGKFFSRTFGRFIPRSLFEKASAVYSEMHELTRSPSTLAAVFGTSCIIQLTRITVHFLCGKAVGIEAGFACFALFVPLMEIAASLPISVGGLGVRETVGAGFFSTVGVGMPDVVAYSLLATLTGFIGSIPGGIAFAMSGKKIVNGQ